jgi:hypothetical protein
MLFNDAKPVDDIGFGIVFILVDFIGNGGQAVAGDGNADKVLDSTTFDTVSTFGNGAVNCGMLLIGNFKK